MTISRKTEAPMTVDAFLAWSEERADGGRTELLDGQVVTMVADRAGHARLKVGAFEALARQIADRGLACEAFPDGMAVRIDDATVFEPDAMVRCGTPIADDVILVGDPLIVVEVVSPSTRRADVLVKLGRYFRNPSLRHYLIVVPDGRLVIRHRRAEDRAIATTSHDDGVVRLVPPGIELAVAALFLAPPPPA